MMSPPPGLPNSLDYPEVPVGSLLAGAAARYGDRTAFQHGEQKLSFSQLWESACRFANALLDRGVGKGDTVALHLPNCLAFPIAYYGTLLAGATFSPANPLLPPGDLAAQLADCEAKAAVTFGPVAAALAGTGVELVIVVQPTDEGQLDFQEFLATAGQAVPRVDVDIDGLAHLAYTGGTTGRSKGVRIPHRNVVVNTLQYACWGSGAVPVLDGDGNPTLDQIGSEDEWPVRLGTGVGINLTPWFHAMGTIGGLNVAVVSGGTVVIHDRFDPPSYVADAQRLRVTSMSGAPALFAALLACEDFHKADLSSVRAITSGAAPMPHEMIKALQRLVPEAVIAEGYGLTEVTMGATLSPSWRSGTRKVGSVGVPIFDTEVKIVPAEGGEEELPPNTPGEVCVRGPQVMLGYHNRQEETAAVLVDGWLHTGDVGVIDDDGFLSIVDRKKDMLIYKGYNVYPRELEELLMALPQVASAAVVGRKTVETGELPVAFVVRAPGHDEATAEQLLDAVNTQVVPYKRLRELHFVDTIPVSAAGKVLKRELRAQLT
ncbi:acyl-CoA synthetase (AMP-forming)/AMP-acid ligase II [Saccharomonospora marina XMU15]|uniref:Acyl-CoA synthetase (AMP-forming)/AMP-acid ligase II n=2 Tax=Saccharomonospora TaxID=1851 RepID=H5X989_9PSEU|nr:acyl-CoA synthetase (AMP-forming)/AMP-acid ligase II [Saccharomonospora marina XMU15]